MTKLLSVTKLITKTLLFLTLLTLFLKFYFIGQFNEYLQEKNSVVVKTCRLYSHKSIDEFGAKVVNCDDLNMTDCETFIFSGDSGVKSLLGDNF